MKKNDTPLLFFSEGAFFRISILQCNADFPFLAAVLASESVSLKKGIPVPFYSKKCVRGLYFEKCVRFNAISSFDGQIEFEVM